MAEFLRRGWDARLALENELQAKVENVRRAGRAANPDTSRGAAHDSPGKPQPKPGAGQGKTGARGKVKQPAKAGRSPEALLRRPLGAASRRIRRRAARALSTLNRPVRADTRALRDDVRRWNVSAERGLRTSTFELLQEIHASREKVRRDLDAVLTKLDQVRGTNVALERDLATVKARLNEVERAARAAERRIAVNCGNGQILVGTSFGPVLVSEDDPALLAVLLQAGDLERGTRLLIERVLGPGDCFIDVGANIGAHTIAAAQAMKFQGRVIALEPFPPTAELLRRSLWINGAAAITEIHVAAAGASPGPATLFLGETCGHHSLFPLQEDASPATADSIEVLVVRLDDLIPPGDRVDLIKIDVEGAELDVLRSAQRVLADNPEVAVIAEFGPSHLGRSRVEAEEWFAAFQSLGMEFRVIDGYNGGLSVVPVDDLMGVASANLLFARPSSPVWSKAAR